MHVHTRAHAHTYTPRTPTHYTYTHTFLKPPPRKCVSYTHGRKEKKTFKNKFTAEVYKGCFQGPLILKLWQSYKTLEVSQIPQTQMIN